MTSKATWLLLWAVLIALAVAAPLRAQSTQDEAFVDAFAPFEGDSFDFPEPPNQGFFFSYESVYWQFSQPAATTIGYPELTAVVPDGSGWRLESNTLDTSSYKSIFQYGHRTDFGRVEGRWGWLGSITMINKETQVIDASDVDVMFFDPGFDFTRIIQQFIPFTPGFFDYVPSVEHVGWLSGFINRGVLDTVDDDLGDDAKKSIFVVENDDPPPDFFFVVIPRFGRFYDGDQNGVINPNDPNDILEPNDYDLADLARLPVMFDRLIAKQTTEMRTFELMPFYRTRPNRRGGVFEVMVGARYLNFTESFNVLALGGVLDKSNWNTNAENHLVGPQVGLRFFQRNNRWMLEAEGRFFSGFNFQNIFQVGTLGSELGPAVPAPSTNRPNNQLAFFPTTHINHTLHINEWCPTSELRLKASYQLTRSFALTAGWSGLFISGIARPSNMVDYTLPAMGITSNRNRQDLIVQGISFGLELNR